MSKKLLHIGLPKCGSTFLQKEIFSEISKKMNISKFTEEDIKNDILKNKNINYHPLENEINLENKLPTEFIFSYEGLFSYKDEFSRIDKSFKLLSKNFSSDVKVLLIIRNPYDFLNSIYSQAIQSMYIIKPENFFYLDQNEIIRKNGKYNLYKFDYNYLISLYKSYFKTVIVVKYENLTDFSYLKEIFDLDLRLMENLNLKKNKLIHRSFSQTSINIINWIHKYIDLNKINKFLRSGIKNDGKKSSIVKNKLIYFFYHSYRSIFKLFDQIYPYKKNYIPKHLIPIDIQKKIDDYNKLQF